MASSGERLKLMVKTFRRECHRVLQSERTTVHGPDAMLALLQLVMAQLNQQRSGEFTVPLSDVLLAWKHFLCGKLHLPPTGAVHLDNYDVIVEAYEASLKRCNSLDLVDVWRIGRQLAHTEAPVSPTQLFDFLSGDREASERAAPSTPPPPSSSSSSSSSRSQVKLEVRRVFCSYLSLLVNAKNDLALALTLDVPARGLGPQAFADIRRAARRDHTSLFLAVTSFVRAVQLGGRGYAPAPSDPLRKHLKGLSNFVHFLDDLEEILGETPDPSECGARLVSSIRAALVKGRAGVAGGDALCAAAEQTATELTERIRHIHRVQAAEGGGTGISPARPRAHKVNHATALGGRDTVKVLLALLDQEALAPPRANKAELLLEEEPLPELRGGGLLTWFRSPEVSSGSSPQPLRTRVQRRVLEQLRPEVQARGRTVRSQFACTYKDEEDLPLKRVLDFPSSSQAPTCVHPAPKRQRPAEEEEEEEQEDEEQQEDGGTAKPPCVCPEEDPPGRQQGAAPLQALQPLRSISGNTRANNKEIKGNKRKQAESGQNQPAAKKRSVKNVSRGAANKRLIQGQAKLTSFFRV